MARHSSSSSSSSSSNSYHALVQVKNLQELPTELLELIFTYVTYDEISRVRIVSKTFDACSQRLLNRGFMRVEKYHSWCFKKVKAQLPRRESERRSHPLARHCDVLSAIETRLSLLGMTFMKYVDMSLCCFIPGKVIDEIYRVLRIIQNNPNPPRVHELLQELRDISSMAMEYFEEKIAPGLKSKMASPDRNNLLSAQLSACKAVCMPSNSQTTLSPTFLSPSSSSRASNSEQEMQKLYSTIKQMQQAQISMKKDMSEMKLKSKDVTMKKEIASLKKKLADLEKTNNESQQTIAELKAQIEDMKRRMGDNDMINTGKIKTVSNTISGKANKLGKRKHDDRQIYDIQDVDEDDDGDDDGENERTNDDIQLLAIELSTQKKAIKHRRRSSLSKKKKKKTSVSEVVNPVFENEESVVIEPTLTTISNKDLTSPSLVAKKKLEKIVNKASHSALLADTNIRCTRSMRKTIQS